MTGFVMKIMKVMNHTKSYDSDVETVSLTICLIAKLTIQR